MNKLSIYVNQNPVYEYDTELNLDDGQLSYLDKLDSDMGRGIKIHGELIENPDEKQRGTFVALNLIKALQQGNEAVISVSCAYLAKRFPDLSEVHVKDHEKTVLVEFVENET